MDFITIGFNLYKIIWECKPAHNGIVYALGLKALGFRSPRSAMPPTAHSSTFLLLLERSAFPYRNRKNVVYNQNVI